MSTPLAVFVYSGQQLSELSLISTLTQSAPNTIRTSHFELPDDSFQPFQSTSLISLVNSASPDRLVLIAPYSSIAKNLGKLKKSLAAQLNLPVFLVVVLPDASFPSVWDIPACDLAVVSDPFLASRIPHANVIPYPLLTSLFAPLPPSHSRFTDLSSSTTPINLAITVSTSHQANFLRQFLPPLSKMNSRLHYYLLQTPGISPNEELATLAVQLEATLIPSNSSSQFLFKYQELFTQSLIHLELSSPDYTIFKTQLSSHQVGGCLQLFFSPTSSAEDANIDWLRRQNLLPDTRHTAKLIEDFHLSPASTPVVPETWRSFVLPNQGLEAAGFLNWLFYTQVFTRISQPKPLLPPDGNTYFWRLVSPLLKTSAL